MQAGMAVELTASGKLNDVLSGFTRHDKREWTLLIDKGVTLMDREILRTMLRIRQETVSCLRDAERCGRALHHCCVMRPRAGVAPAPE